MDTGRDFLVAQVNNACAQYEAFTKALRDHAAQADDERFRQLCMNTQHRADECYAMLGSYRDSLGETSGGGIKKAIGTVFGAARDLADAPRDSDFLRLVGDIVLGRQAEDTFKIFREAGRQLGIQQLARIGDMGEQIQDDYVHAALKICQTLFVEQMQAGDGARLQREASTETTA